MPSTDAAGIILMEAFFDFSAGEYEKAKTKIRQAGGHGPLNHIGLSLLGKVLLKIRGFEEALKVMETANKMAPTTVDRLCDMADAYGEMGQEDQLDDVIGKIKKSGTDIKRSTKLAT